jgi:hypothetical protein
MDFESRGKKELNSLSNLQNKNPFHETLYFLMTEKSHSESSYA